jgi:GT2 family glycosyltransferase
MRISVVILNYQTPQLVTQNLESLAHERAEADDAGPTFTAVVVDNASSDGSADQIEAAIDQHGWGDWARVVYAGRNDGFAAGNNRGIEADAADAYLLLNSDTYVRPGALKALQSALVQAAYAGLIGARLEWPDATTQASRFRFITPLSELIAAAETGPITRLLRRHVVALAVTDAPAEADWVSFAGVLIRRAVIDQVGLLDEGYFMYFEDVDYARRVRQAGWGVRYWPAARIVHLRGGSSSVKAKGRLGQRRPRYYYAARSRYFRKSFGRAGLWAANLLWLLGRGVSWTREKLSGKKPHVCRREWLDIWTNA